MGENADLPIASLLLPLEPRFESQVLEFILVDTVRPLDHRYVPIIGANLYLGLLCHYG